MNFIYKKYLFSKHIIVRDQKADEKCVPEVLFSLAKLFNIRITKGGELAHRDMIMTVENIMIGTKVPEPFYRGFPQSVLKLADDRLYYDQILNYLITYGLGDMSKTRHSVFENEDDILRKAFKETGSIKDFIIVKEDEAVSILQEMIDNALKGTRPLSEDLFECIEQFVKEYDYDPFYIASKNTAVKLIVYQGDTRYAKHLDLSDVIKLTEELNYHYYYSVKINKLNLKNKHRKLISEVIHKTFESGRADVSNCFEKKRNWAGLLHHIHFKPVNEDEKKFADLMRGDVNMSSYSRFEKEMREKNIRNALSCLEDSKGRGAVLRNLNYILSRCESEEDVRFVLDSIDTKNTIILIQLYISYLQYSFERKPRSFSYVKFNMSKSHIETQKEVERRRSLLDEDTVGKAKEVIVSALRKNLKGRLGRVYIDPSMANYALPIQESAGSTGLGVLPKGSRIHIGDAKKIRGFTYWELVDDIDLSVIGLDGRNVQTEFSWRTMANRQSKAIVYSGDETSGYNGGSEYFDVDIEEFRALYPDVRYLIFCDNVFSDKTFARCFCKAGYMLRDKEDSGRVFEPKTIESSFIVNNDSRFCYLFAVDLTTGDFVWINTRVDSFENVAGLQTFGHLVDLINVTYVFNLKDFFEMCAEEVTDDIGSADVIITDKTIDIPDGKEIIREYDFEKIIALMN